MLRMSTISGGSSAQLIEPPGDDASDEGLRIGKGHRRPRRGDCRAWRGPAPAAPGSAVKHSA